VLTLEDTIADVGFRTCGFRAQGSAQADRRDRDSLKLNT